MHNKIVACCLCMMLVLCSIVGNGNASALSSENNADYTSALGTIGVLSPSGKDISALTLSELPAQMLEHFTASAESAAQFTELDLSSSEDLNTVVAIREDGTHSMLSFSQPVKYFDEGSNAIKFIDNTLKEPEDSLLGRVFSQIAYENTGNDIRVALPKRIQQGIVLEKKEHSIRMTPVAMTNPAAVKKEVSFLEQSETMVEYKDAFGEHIHLQYAAVNQGVKENILLEQYTGIHEFSFLVEAPGLVPDTTEGATIQMMDEITGGLFFSFNQLGQWIPIQRKLWSHQIHQRKKRT